MFNEIRVQMDSGETCEQSNGANISHIAACINITQATTNIMRKANNINIEYEHKDYILILSILMV